MNILLIKLENPGLGQIVELIKLLGILNMKYKLVKYPEIEEYLENLDPEEVFYDDKKNVWFVPEIWEMPSIDLDKDNIWNI